MYDTKVLKKTGEKLVAYQSTWLVEDTIAVSELELCPRAVLKAPEGKVPDPHRQRSGPPDQARHL